MDRKLYLKIKVADFRRRLKERAVVYKGGRCRECGYDKCLAALEFHHRDPDQKEFRLSSGRAKNWESVKKELDKCDLLCANCHREVHEKHRSETLEAHRQYLAEKKRPERVDLNCAVCDKVFSTTPSLVESRKHCSKECRAKGSEKTAWPSNSELKKLIWSTSVRSVAKELGVSDQSVRKRCRRRGIQTPPVGWNPWSQRRSG